jgi:hypothetical protein
MFKELEKLIPDAYSLRARLFPSLIVVLPLALVVIMLFPSKREFLGSLVSLFVGCGGIALLTQIGRDRGKQSEINLYEMWGGKPTTLLLRYRNSTNKVILDKRRKKLQELCPDLQLPTKEEEDSLPSRADEIYEACIAFLRNNTRDKDKFNLISEENCNYGFRRNLWGFKSIGIFTSLISLIVSIMNIALILLVWKMPSTPPFLSIFCIIFASSFLIFWIFWVTPNWVKIAAYAYAERLLDACDSL